MARLYAVFIGSLWLLIPTVSLAAQSNEAEEIEQWLNEQWDSFVSDDIGTLILWGVVVVLIVLWARFRNVSQHDPTYPAPTRVPIDYGHQPARRISEQQRDESYSTDTRGRESRQSRPPPRPWG